MSASCHSRLVLGIELTVVAKPVTRTVTRFDVRTAEPKAVEHAAIDLELKFGDRVFPVPADTDVYSEVVAENPYLYANRDDWARQTTRARVDAYFAGLGFVTDSSIPRTIPEDALHAFGSRDRWVVGRLLAKGGDDGYPNSSHLVEVPAPSEYACSALEIRLGVRLEMPSPECRLYLITNLSG
jgi:hypothetical protein